MGIVCLYIKLAEVSFLHASAPNPPLDMPNTLATSAIATSVGVVVVAALILITMVLCLTKERRRQPQSKRVSVIAPVIDICRPAHSNVDRDSRIEAPQRPREAILSSRQPSPGIRAVTRYEDTSRRIGSYVPSGPVKTDLDLEAQLWKPSREKRNAKAGRSHTPSHISPSVGLPLSPPPSYSQIDRCLLVAAV